MVWFFVASAQAEPTCDRVKGAALAAEVAGAPRAERPQVLGRGWGAVCTVDAWHDVAAEIGQLSDPVRLHLVELQLAVGRAHLLPELCSDPAPSLVFSQATKMAEPAGRGLLYERCLLHRTGFYTADEFAAAPGGAWLSLFAWAELRAGGWTAAEARPLVRAVAGLDP